jgi:DNA-binding MarR family transcriptional regulator
MEKKAKELSKYIGELTRKFMFMKAEVVPPEYEFNMRELLFIIYLGWRESCKMSEVAEHMGLAMSTATGIADRLVHKDLIRRNRSEEDRRLVEVELTPKGREVYEWHTRQHIHLSRTILESLDQSDQEALIVLMRKIVENSHEVEH